MIDLNTDSLMNLAIATDNQSVKTETQLRNGITMFGLQSTHDKSYMGFLGRLLMKG